mmetsp:Transcript_95453/g.165801  ORF Transcript_95453/g.165801 Transcript_95453/m.165801 type:complete len:272 (-) Transcript_95453:259-1074(-)
MAPESHIPAGSYKWRADEYWQRHEGLMTIHWPERYQRRERAKNTPASVNVRTMNSSLAATLGLNRTAMNSGPSDLLSPLKRDLLKKEAASAWAPDDNFGFPNPGSPIVNSRNSSRRPSGAQRTSPARGMPPARAITPPGISRRAIYGDRAARPKEGLGENTGEFRNFMGRSSSSPSFLQGGQERPAVVNAWGTTPPMTPTSSEKRRRPVFDGSRSQFGLQNMTVAFPEEDGPAPFTTNQIYGMRQVEAEPPSSAADKGRKLKTCSSVVMGM